MQPHEITPEFMLSMYLPEGVDISRYKRLIPKEILNFRGHVWSIKKKCGLQNERNMRNIQRIWKKDEIFVKFAYRSEVCSEHIERGNVKTEQ